MSCNLTFTPLLCKKAEEYFEAARPFFGSRAQEIEDGLAQCSAAHNIAKLNKFISQSMFYI